MWWYAVPAVSLVLGVLGYLLFFEVIRPFRDGKIDIPIAIICWSLAFGLAVLAAIFLWGPRWMNVSLAVVHGISLGGFIVFAVVISRSWKLF